MPKDTYYKATLHFPENLKDQAQELLAKTKQDSATEKPPQVYLLTSITANNEVIMWLSNAASKKQNPDRTLIELDRKKGEVYISGWERDWMKEDNSEN
jgi:phosphoribosylformimino-5-aminoimidazole carboxamide ribonucleotide (ProFAR) isomerase